MKTKFVSIIVMLLLAAELRSQVPVVIHYQGNLADASNNPVNRTINMQFKLYSTSTGGTSLWEETHSSVVVTKGLFNVPLGSRTAFPRDVFAEPKYLEIVIGGELLTPRQQIGSVPYAISSRTALGLLSTSNTLSDIVAHTYSNDGNVTGVLVDVAGPVVLLSGAVHGPGFTNGWSVRITVDGSSPKTFTPQRYEDIQDDENYLFQLPPILANTSLKIEIIATDVRGEAVGAYAWTKKL